jgi:hypothetical protein
MTNRSLFVRRLTCILVLTIGLAACAPAPAAVPTSTSTAVNTAVPTEAPTAVPPTQAATTAPTEAATVAASPVPSQTQTTGKVSALEFHDTMRLLWLQHIEWTRLYIVSFAAGLPDTDATAKRLLDNQTDIGNAVRPFYGDEAAEVLTALLEDHIMGAVDILKAAKAGDTAAQEAASTKWYGNANDIAAFLSQANPDNWPLADMQAGMKMHLDVTLEEATAQLKGDAAGSIAGYDKVEEHILMLADLLSSGIMKQFPDKFDSASMLASEALKLHDGMRQLWQEHVFWTRLYIVSFAAGLPDTDATAQRLLDNQTDIGDAMRPFYGDEAADQLIALLKDHIMGAVDILTAAKAGDMAAQEAASTKWYANADEIAAFLNKANPDNWPLADMQAGMKMHLDVTLEEATAHLKGDSAVSIAKYEEVEHHILMLADLLSNGVAKQFPDKVM